MEGYTAKEFIEENKRRLSEKWTKEELNKWIQEFVFSENFNSTVFVNDNNVPIYIHCWGKKLYTTDQINQ